MVGVGKGAGAGVLIKSAEALERMEKVDTLVVDKTGTLTEGKPQGRRPSCRPPGLTEADCLPLAASLERSSEHPLAAAIVAARASERHRGRKSRPTSPRSPARASPARSADAAWRWATQALMARPGDRLRRACGEGGRTARATGATALFVAVDGRPAASSPSPTRQATPPRSTACGRMASMS